MSNPTFMLGLMSSVGKSALSIGTGAANLADTVETLERQGEELDRVIAQERVQAKSLAQIRMAEFQSRVGAIDAAAGVAGVAGATVAQLKGSEALAQGIEDASATTAFAARASQLGAERRSVPGKINRAKVNFGLSTAASLLGLGTDLTKLSVAKRES